MYKSAFILSLTLSSLPVVAVEIGNTYEQVVAEKGAPPSKMELSEVRVLNYPDATIKLRDGKVISVKPISPSATTANVFHAEPPAAVVPWTTDYAGALVQAKAEKRKVILFFTGSDWSAPSKRLDKEILSTRDFVTYAHDNAILVKLDYPKKTAQTPELKTQNSKLLEQYKVADYPAIIVLSSNGEVLSTLGYEEGGPTPYIKKLKGP